MSNKSTKKMASTIRAAVTAYDQTDEQVKSICKRFGLSAGTLVYHLRQRGIPLRRERTRLKWIKLLSEFQRDGASPVKVARQLGVWIGTVEAAQEATGIRLRRANDKRYRRKNIPAQSDISAALNGWGR